MDSPTVTVNISSTEDLEPPSTYAATDVVAYTIKSVSSHSACSVDLHFCDAETITQANGQFRDKPRPTNVLSFPSDMGEESWAHLLAEEALVNELGSIMMCLPVIEQEAVEFGLSVEQRLAHLTVHATLHLLGYDHETPEHAAHMEALESQILLALNYKDPWA